MDSYRYDDDGPSRPPFDVIALGGRIATLISYGQSKKEIVDKLRGEGFIDDQIFLGYAAAQMMLGPESDEVSLAQAKSKLLVKKILPVGSKCSNCDRRVLPGETLRLVSRGFVHDKCPE